MSVLTGITDNYNVTAEENWQSNLDGTITSGATTLTVLSNASYTIGEWVLWTIDAVDPSTGEATPAKKEVVYGQIAASNQLTNVVRGVEGTAQSHTNNAVVYDYMTAAHNNIIHKRMDTEHNPNGTHSDITADSITTASLTVTGESGGLTPTGAITAYPVATAPSGWLLCDGSAVSRTTYSALFTLLSTTYGAGNGTTTFNLPNLKGKVVVGLDSTQTEFDVLGETGGAKTHTLTTAEMPSHTHSADPPATATDSQGSHSHTIEGSANWGTSGGYGISEDATASSNGTLNTDAAGAHTHTVNIASFNTGSAGTGGAHNNLQPYMVLNYIIKV